jgi:hypothetical protein
MFILQLKLHSQLHETKHTWTEECPMFSTVAPFNTVGRPEFFGHSHYLLHESELINDK